MDDERVEGADGPHWPRQVGEPARRRPGRPALGRREGASPRIVFRVPAELKQALRAAARRTGRRESDLAREALERYLAP